MDAAQIITSNPERIPANDSVRIVNTTPEHIREISGKLRVEDANEIISFGISPNKALWRSYKVSLIAKTGFVNGEIAACWGLGGVPLGIQGTPWLLTTDAVKNISPLKFARLYQKEVYNMLKFFPVLSNWVDSRYDAAIRLLDIVGFKLGEPEKLGNGIFCKFEMRK